MLKNTQIFSEEISQIEEIDFDGYVYDTYCENPHLYVTGDFISHNCILWVDEIEKGLSGGQSSGKTDGGTTSRVISTFLTWLQEKTSPVFIFCTANDWKQIPPEFMRRFDEVFFVDLPSEYERRQIFEVLLRRYKRSPEEFDINKLASRTDKYSGAEIEKVIKEALYIGLSEKFREITDKDLMNIIATFRPLAIMREEEFVDLRKWAKSRCKMANSVQTIKNSKKTETLDIDI